MQGEEGVCEVLRIMMEEVRQAFVLSGCNSVTDVQSLKNLVVHQTHYTHHSAKL